jgi:transposase
MPVEFRLTPGQKADVTQGEALLEGHQSEAVIADKGYDSDAFVAAIEARGAEAVIPSRKTESGPARTTAISARKGIRSSGF